MSRSQLRPTRPNILRTSSSSWILKKNTRSRYHPLSAQAYAQGGLVSSLLPGVVTVVLTFSSKHAKVSREGALQASNISNAEIEAAKQEWANLVLSDNE